MIAWEEVQYPSRARTAKDKPMYGEVLAVGPGKYNEDGKRIVMNVKVGDKVLYSKYGGTDLTHDNDDLLILHENDILAIIDK